MQPLVHAADDLGAALAPVPAVEQQVEIELEIAEVFEEGRRRGVPGRPDRALVVRELGDLDEAPLRPVELRAVGLAENGTPTSAPVGAVAPAVVRADEVGRVALVVAADLHAAMAAGVQEDVDRRRPGRGRG